MQMSVFKPKQQSLLFISHMSVENQAKMELTNMNQINGYYKCKQVGIN